MYFKNCCILVYLFFAAGEAECSVGDILVIFTASNCILPLSTSASM